MTQIENRTTTALWTMQGNTLALGILRIVSERPRVTMQEIRNEMPHEPGWMLNRQVLELSAAGLIVGNRHEGEPLTEYYTTEIGDLYLQTYDAGRKVDDAHQLDPIYVIAGLVFFGIIGWLIHKFS